jgi:hypothetical protein
VRGTNLHGSDGSAASCSSKIRLVSSSYDGRFGRVIEVLMVLSPLSAFGSGAPTGPQKGESRSSICTEQKLHPTPAGANNGDTFRCRIPCCYRCVFECLVRVPPGDQLRCIHCGRWVAGPSSGAHSLSVRWVFFHWVVVADSLFRWS